MNQWENGCSSRGLNASMDTLSNTTDWVLILYSAPVLTLGMIYVLPERTILLGRLDTTQKREKNNNGRHLPVELWVWTTFICVVHGYVSS